MWFHLAIGSRPAYIPLFYKDGRDSLLTCLKEDNDAKTTAKLVLMIRWIAITSLVRLRKQAKVRWPEQAIVREP